MDPSATALIESSIKMPALPVADTSLGLPSVAPDDLASARFAAIMKPSPVAEAAEPATIGRAETSVANAAAGDALDAPKSLGDKMLASLQTRSEDFKATFDKTVKQLQSDEILSVREIVSMQTGILRASIEYELLGKLVSRSTQNIDQLVRIQ